MALKPSGQGDQLSPSTIRKWLRDAKLHSSNNVKDLALFQVIDGILLSLGQTNSAVATVSSGSGGSSTPSGTSGNYTPTLTNVTNITGNTAYQCYYYIVDTIVTVFGTVDINPTAAGVQTQLGMSLPVVSLLTSASQLAGVAQALNIGMESCAIIGDATNDRAQFDWVAGFTGSQKFYFSFSYQIL